MELIGVMAIIAILASVMAPGLTDAIDKAYGEEEVGSLEVFGSALERHILNTGEIPSMDTSDWAPAIASLTDVPVDKVEFNSRGYKRQLYIDPRFFTASDTKFTGYTQDAGLAGAPNSPRMMLISSLDGNLPKAPKTGASFAAIWDQTDEAGVVAGKKTKIERLNLGSRFHLLVLTNSSDQQGAYALGNGSQNPVPAAVGGVDGTIERYVIESTRLKLHASPFPSGDLETTVLLRNSLSAHYVTDGSRWFWERS